MIRPLLLLAALLVPLSAQAGDAALGRKKASACQTCHGMDGLSKLSEPDIANLAAYYAGIQIEVLPPN